MSGVKEEPEPERIFGGIEANRDPNAFDQIDLNGLVVGAAIRFVRKESNGDITVELTGDRKLIVVDGHAGARLQCDIGTSDLWSVPVPIVVRHHDEHGFGDYLDVLDTIHTLFAVLLLFGTIRQNHLYEALRSDPTGRSLRKLIGPDEITIASSAAGSWYIDLIPKTREAFKAAFALGLSLTPFGREHLRRRIEAATKLQEAKSEIAVIEVEQHRIKLKQEWAIAIQEQVKAASSLADLQQKKLSKLPPDDPVRRTVENGLQLLMVEAARSDTK